METANREQLLASLLSEDLKTYRSLENWGATLFLTAIALIAKQIFEWDQLPSAPLKQVVPASITSIPAMVGLVAYAFLRIINFRTSRTWKRLYEAALPRDKGTSAGWLGWLIAAMPLALGLFVTWVFAAGDPLRWQWLKVILVIGGAIIVYSIYWHLRARRNE